MESWGPGNFENEQALDWITNLQNHKDLTPIHTTFSIIAKGVHSEAHDCANALVAIEVIAALRGMPSKHLPDELDNWISSNDLSLDDDLTTTAKHILNKISRSSELRDIWETSGNLDKWEKSLDDLLGMAQVSFT